MSTSDKEFSGSIPQTYHRFMEPLLFEPYAADLARMAAALRPSRILEIAAGTGVVTAAMVRALGADARITATDLNQGMLDLAMTRIDAPNVSFQACDATKLAFEDQAFDLVVCQFGVMFFPDKLAAYREARRVLRPGGAFLFNVWDSFEANPLPATVTETLAELFPRDPPRFLARTPHGYHDVQVIRVTLEGAGFSDVRSKAVEHRSRAPSAHAAVVGMSEGSPLRAEIEQRGGSLPDITAKLAQAISARFGADAIDLPMQAIVFEATA